MRARELEATIANKSRRLQQGGISQTDNAPSVSFDPLAPMITRVSKASSASVHAATLNRVTGLQPSHAEHAILQLQRCYGNSYVQRVLTLARATDREGEAAPAVEEAIQQARGGGQALDSGVRAQMEAAFGADFGGVRAHADAGADMLNRALSARAFTVGQDIFFKQGEYSPASRHGRELLAHELTHVVQQNSDKGQRKLVIGAPDDQYEQEADQVARAVMQRQMADDEPEEESGQRLMRAGQVKRQMAAEGKKEEPIRTTVDGNRVQRRLVAFGTLRDVNALLGLIGPRAGLSLTLNVADNQVQIGAVLPAAPPSPALRTQFTTIIGHATQHAEVIVARGQPQVQVGAFPQPSDLTITRVQQIDIDDILAIEKGAPGNGVAKAAHEINENFQAHAAAPAAGADLFAGAHQVAIAAESAVTAELVGPGRRVADVTIATGPNSQRVIQDFENYYLVYRTLTNAATQNLSITSAMRRPKVTISTHTIDNFGSISPFMPGAGAAIITAANADVAANPTATVRIEGFADNTEPGSGVVTALRASGVETALQTAGVAAGRIHAEGRGATNFVVPNTTPANMALNRRVVITVTRPGP